MNAVNWQDHFFLLTYSVHYSCWRESALTTVLLDYSSFPVHTLTFHTFLLLLMFFLLLDILPLESSFSSEKHKQNYSLPLWLSYSILNISLLYCSGNLLDYSLFNFLCIYSTFKNSEKIKAWFVLLTVVFLVPSLIPCRADTLNK